MVVAMLAEGMAEMNFGDSEPLAMFLIVVASGYLALERDLKEPAGQLLAHEPGPSHAAG